MMGLGVWLLAIRIGVLGIFAPTHVRLASGGRIADVRLDGNALRVDGRREERLRVEGSPLVEVRVLDGAGQIRFARRFHGAVEVRAGAAALRLVNELPGETYLVGTVAQETAGTHPEALKAQAVLARSLALAGARHATEGFDLCDLTHCQVYRGSEGETPAAAAAVRATTGEVVLAADRIAVVHFTAACGGATAAVEDVWPGAAPLPWLRSVPCRACQEAGGPPWNATLPRATIDRALGGGGRLTGLRVLERGTGGHVRRVLLEGDGRVLDGETLRILLGRAVGWNRFRSLHFSVENASPDGDQLRFSGRGQGHGVGVCQTGAAALARSGLDHRAILRRYLPGAEPGPVPGPARLDAHPRVP